MSINKQDIVTAILNSDTFLKVPELKGAKPRIESNGKPYAFTGGFNMVFQLEHQNKKWAFRVWHVPMGEHTDRYRKISKYLSEKKLPYFADFIYDEKGILVNGNLLDTIRMEWLEGKLLKEYLEENLGNKNILTKLANDFLEMCKTLRENKISHGDLQEGNILIDRNGNIKLVDYDSICIPEIESQKELVTGLKGYQHPSRFKAGKASLKADYFSELVIYLAILSLSENPNLWNKYELKTTENFLLFTDSDFEDFENSEIYKDLQNLSSSVRSLIRILNEYLKENSYLNLKGFENYLTAPTIINFNANEIEILQGKSIELSWNVENADTILLNNGIGNITGKKSLSVSPIQTTTYQLTAENAFGIVEQEISIEVLPLPKIIFRSQQQKIEYGKETQIVWDIDNAEKIELHWLGNMEIVPNKGEKNISPTDHTNYKLIITALDGVTIEEKEITVQVFKRVEIIEFKAENEFIFESQYVYLEWNVKNATKIMLIGFQKSNKAFEEDVSSKHNFEIKLKDDTIFYLEAQNDLFNSNQTIEINVEKAPRIPPLPDLPKGKELLPSFELNFKVISENILNETQIAFEAAMKPTKRFSLYNALQKILRL